MILTVILIIAVSAVIVTIAFTAFYVYITGEHNAATEPPEPSAMPSTTILEYELPMQTFDLADGKYVQLKIVMRYPELKNRIWFGLREEVDETLPNAIKTCENQILDAIQSLMRSQSSSSLRGSNNETRVKSELMDQINKILATKYGITEVLFVGTIISS